MHEENPVLKIYNLGAMVHRWIVYIYLLNVPSFFSRYFNKIKRTSRLGRLLALSLEILCSAERYGLAENIKRNKPVKLFEFGQVVQQEMSLKDVSLLALIAILFSGAKPNVQF